MNESYKTEFTEQIRQLRPTNPLEYKFMLEMASMLLNKINKQWDVILDDKNNQN